MSRDDGVTYWLAMPAAGAGRRFGAPAPKQYMPLAGRTVIEWALAPFLLDPRCCGVVVALARDDEHGRALLGKLGRAGLECVDGAAQRADSVSAALEGLSARAAPQDWVLVHDAVRPCLGADDRDRLLAALPELATERGALLATPLIDTLKRATREPPGRNADPAALATRETISREQLWRALTPQAFRLGELSEALREASGRGRSPTDEAQAIEWCGGASRLVRGEATNIKITSPGDLALAQALLAGDTAARMPA